MSTDKTKTEEVTPQEEVTNSSEIIELEWPEVEQIFALRESLTSIEANFSSMCLNFEKRKMEVLSTMKEYENAMYSLAGQLKEQKKRVYYVYVHLFIFEFVLICCLFC